MPWAPHELAAAFADGLRRHEAALCAEQAVHGLDALAEVHLHPILAAGAVEAGFVAFRETPYPGQPEVLPRESARERCDLVLAPGGTIGIADVIRARKALRRAEGTLFASVAQELSAPGEAPPEEACWLEVKTFGQYTYTDDIAGPNRTYASQFGTCLSDVRKLARARGLGDAALVVVHFAADESVAEHDLTAFVHRCLDRDLPVTGLIREAFPVLDRIGNRVCTVAIVPVRPERGDYETHDS
jgi:hypothetical protein